MFQGKTLALTPLENGFVELCFNRAEGSVNKLDRATTDEIEQALDVLDKANGAKNAVNGLLVTSGKSVFIVGADITEFGHNFSQPEADVRARLRAINGNLSRFESFPFPVVVAINGFAMGGGLELCLACDYRIMASTAQIGLPETRLGIIPGWGGTVRLPRIIGLDNAVEWIAGGAHQKAPRALAVGAVDAVIEPGQLRDEALKVLERCASGQLPVASRRQQKVSPLRLNAVELQMAATTGKAMVAAQAGRHYPAPVAAVDCMVKAAGMTRDEALEVEGKTIYQLTQTPQCRALVGLFLSDQYIGKLAREQASRCDVKIARAAVLGAGIMGGGIAYQNAQNGLPIMMKDIRQDALDLGLGEANKLLAKQVERGRCTPLAAGEVLGRIDATLSYDSIDQADVVVEAVVENPAVKEKVLAEVESLLADSAILVSNTSTISISRLAKKLERPQNFCGMHFFNPVHAMPLVEVIRGEKTSDATVAGVVSYALALGKKPLVVNDCPGFLVNRVLFPYFSGFDLLLRDGADFRQVDKVMEGWGWPMGPAYLLDVVGIDTGVHGAAVMAEGFPDRMGTDYVSATKLLFDAGRLGQKSGSGFYSYEADRKGKPKKVFRDEVLTLFAEHVAPPREFDADDITARMMVPMCIELARCLEEGIVASAAEADMGLINGIGFPPFRGGVFRWLDETGLNAFCAMADKFQALGKAYQPTDTMRRMVTEKRRYYA